MTSPYEASFWFARVFGSNCPESKKWLFRPHFISLAASASMALDIQWRRYVTKFPAREAGFVAVDVGGVLSDKGKDFHDGDPESSLFSTAYTEAVGGNATKQEEQTATPRPKPEAKPKTQAKRKPKAKTKAAGKQKAKAKPKQKNDKKDDAEKNKSEQQEDNEEE